MSDWLLTDSRPRRFSISSVRRRHLRGLQSRSGIGGARGRGWPLALSFLPKPLPCSSLLVGPSRAGSLTGTWMNQSSDQIGKVQKPQNWSFYLLPSRSFWGTEALSWEPFLGLGEALVCNLNVASFMEESLLLRKALG